jgi:hypothetical protein
LEEISKTGVIWLDMLTFNQPLQPVMLHAESPFNGNEEGGEE